MIEEAVKNILKEHHIPRYKYDITIDFINLMKNTGLRLTYKLVGFMDDTEQDISIQSIQSLDLCILIARQFIETDKINKMILYICWKNQNNVEIEQEVFNLTKSAYIVLGNLEVFFHCNFALTSICTGEYDKYTIYNYLQNRNRCIKLGFYYDKIIEQFSVVNQGKIDTIKLISLDEETRSITIQTRDKKYYKVEIKDLLINGILMGNCYILDDNNTLGKYILETGGKNG